MLNSFVYRLFFRVAYWFISTIDKKGEVRFMNYGYHEKEKELILSTENEKNRYAIQLYHQLVTSVNCKDKNILEVGSGRGGGLNYIYHNFFPASATGIDLNQKAIEFCNHQYQGNRLNFIQGNAESLPIKSESADVIINIESSHGYPHLEKFLSEVHRVLKRGGYFLFADFRPKLNLPLLGKRILDARLKIISERLITENVVSALDLIHHSREEQIAKLVPGIFRGMSRHFTALKGTPMYNNFKNREYEYVLFVIQK